MNELKIATTPKVVITLMLMITVQFVFANVDEIIERNYEVPTPKYSVQDIKDRLSNLSSVIDIQYTPEVGKRIKEYTVNYRVAGENILGRVDMYFPIFDAEIQNLNLPEELKYIAVVESNLEPTAKSKSGASGLWQFIKSTGKMQGLEINSYIDERNDPLKSTKAALDYLSYLHKSFGDWTLAIAAYNCGPGNVRKAIRKGGSKDYWKIRKFLPRETQKYVPRVIAAMYLLRYYHEHNLQPKSLDVDLKQTVVINDGKGHSFKKLAKDLDVSYQHLRLLNPMYKTKSFPKNSGNRLLVIPASRKNIYLAHYSPKEYAAMQAEKRRIEGIKTAEIKPTPKPKTLLTEVARIEQLIYRKIISKKAKPSVNISM